MTLIGIAKETKDFWRVTKEERSNTGIGISSIFSTNKIVPAFYLLNYASICELLRFVPAHKKKNRKTWDPSFQPFDPGANHTASKFSARPSWLYSKWKYIFPILLVFLSFKFFPLSLFRIYFSTANPWYRGLSEPESKVR